MLAYTKKEAWKMNKDVDIQIFVIFVKLRNHAGYFDYFLTICIYENGEKIRSLTVAMNTARA